MSVRVSGTVGLKLEGTPPKEDVSNFPGGGGTLEENLKFLLFEYLLLS